jgi:hypothetical protein
MAAPYYLVLDSRSPVASTTLVFAAIPPFGAGWIRGEESAGKGAALGRIHSTEWRGGKTNLAAPVGSEAPTQPQSGLAGSGAAEPSTRTEEPASSVRVEPSARDMRGWPSARDMRGWPSARDMRGWPSVRAIRGWAPARGVMMSPTLSPTLGFPSP